MTANLEKLKTYLKNKIAKLKEEEKKIKKEKEDKRIADEIVDLLENEMYSKINFEDLKKLFTSIYGNGQEKIIQEVKKVEEACSYSELFYMPQFKNIKDYLTKLKEQFIKYSKRLDIDIFKNEQHFKRNNIKYEEYISLIGAQGIQRHLEQKELQDFFAFLRETTLEEEVIFNLIVEFSKDSLEYHMAKAKLEDKKRVLKIEKTSVKVATDIGVKKPKAQSRKVQKEETLQVEILSNEEQEIVRQAEDIIKVLEANIKNYTEEPLVELLAGNYELSNREKVYSSSNNKWNVILNDLNNNLLPNINSNKKQILDILKYIIDSYEKEKREILEQDEKPFISRVEDFSEEERIKIDEFIKLARYELMIYDNLSAQDKNIIHSIEIAIKENEFETINDLNSNYSIAYVECLNQFRELITKYSEYTEARAEEKEYAMEGMQDESDSFIISTMSDIRNNIRQLEENYKILTEERNINKRLENVSSNFDYHQPRKNLILFLPSGNGEYYITSEQKEIMSDKKESIKVLPDVFKQLYALNFEEYRKMLGRKNSKILDSKRQAIIDEMNPHKIRRGEIRIAYIALPLSRKNRDFIKQELNDSIELDDDFRLILFFAVDNKLTDQDDAYRYFNSQLEHELNKIRQIKKIFGEDFSEETMSYAIKLINESNNICENLIENPYKIVSPNRSGEGIGGK